MLVHRKMTPSNTVAGTHLCTWVVRVKCIAQEHNTMSLAKALTRSRGHRASLTCAALIHWLQLSLLTGAVYLCWLVGLLTISSCYLDNVSKETAIWHNTNFARGWINTRYSASAGRNMKWYFIINRVSTKIQRVLFDIARKQILITFCRKFLLI